MIAPSAARLRPLSLQPAAARQQVGRILGDAGWPGDVDAVSLAVHEAMVNALRHGGGVTAAGVGIAQGTVLVEVRDEGPGFDLPLSPEMPDPAAESGRGLFLIRRLASSATVTRSGSEVTLALRFDE